MKFARFYAYLEYYWTSGLLEQKFEYRVINPLIVSFSAWILLLRWNPLFPLPIFAQLESLYEHELQEELQEKNFTKWKLEKVLRPSFWELGIWAQLWYRNDTSNQTLKLVFL